jgi:outer membrane protein
MTSVQKISKQRAPFLLIPGILALGMAAAAVGAQTGTPSTTQPPTGTVPLPQGPPPTGLQAPLPPPAAPLPNPEKPALVSPDLRQLVGRIPTQPLTIDDAVALALATNRSLALSGEALLHAQGRTSEMRAAFNPTLGSTFTYTRLDQGSTANFGGQSITIVNPDQPVFGVQATLPIDISGLLRAATQQAQFQEVATRLDINRTRNQIVLDVKSAFYDVLRAQALVAVATENLQNSEDRLSDAEKRFRAGVVARFDVIRAQTDVANAQQQLIQARSNVSLAIAILNNTIGIDVDTPTRVTDTGAVATPPGVAEPTAAPLPGGVGNPPVPEANPAAPPAAGAQPPAPTPRTSNVVFDSLNLGPDYDAVLREALQTRPEILESDASIAAARKGIQIARRSQLPTLGLSIGASYNPNAAGFAPRTTSGQFVVSVSLPLFDGGTARARVREARADVATAETNRRQALDQVSLEVRQAYLTLLQARNRVAVANQGLVQAREGFRLARVRYNAGVSSQAGISPLLEVSDAQAALAQAQNSQVNALYDYNGARARLDKAIGRYSFVLNGPGYASPPSPKETGHPGPGVPK